MQQGHMWEILVLSVTMRSALVKEQYDTRLNERAQTTKALDSIVHTVHDRHHWNQPAGACMHVHGPTYRKKLERTRSQQTGNDQPHLISL